MAAEEENTEIDEESSAAAKNKKVAKYDSSAADLEKVTDYAEEAEISAQSIGDAMKVVNDRQTKDASDKQQKEKELSRVKINKDDVDLIVQEMEISQQLAERKLREHQGNLVEALVALTN